MKQTETLKAIALLSEGTGVREVARQIKTSPATISRLKNKDSNKELIEKSANKYIKETLNNIIDKNIAESIAAKDISERHISYLKDNDHSKYNEVIDNKVISSYDATSVHNFLQRIDKKETDFLRSIGILNSHTPAQVFQTLIYNDNKGQINQQVMQVLRGTTDWIDEPDDNDDK